MKIFLALFLLLSPLHFLQAFRVSENTIFQQKPMSSKNFLESQSTITVRDDSNSLLKTHLYYLGIEYFNKIDHLNRTLETFNQNQFVYNISSKVNQLTYTIYQASPVFKYLQNKQNASIIGNDTIVIEGDNATVQLSFNWTIILDLRIINNGSGRAKWVMKDLVYAYDMNLTSDGFIEMHLLDWMKPLFVDFTLDSFSPSIPDEEKNNFIDLLNSADSIRSLMTNDISKNIYPIILNQTIRNMNPFSRSHKQIDYQWQPSWTQKPFNYTFIKKTISIDVTKSYVQMEYVFGNQTDISFSNIKIISAMQQFSPYSFYVNFVWDLIQNGALDTVLDRDFWSVPDFRFLGKDLERHLTEIMPRFKAYDSVVISCNARRNRSQLWVGLANTSQQSDFFVAQIGFGCEVSIKQTKIMNASVSLTLDVKGIPQFDHMDFWISNSKFNWSSSLEPGFQLKDKTITRDLISKMLVNLLSSRLVGSGFPLEIPYKNPGWYANANGTVVYEKDLMLSE